MNARFYKGKVLLNRPPATGPRGVRLLHDNASSHKAPIVREYLKQEKVVEFPHPPYSPDLAPCDCFLFPRKTPRWKKYQTRKNLGSAIFQCLNSIPRKYYENAYKNWIKRLTLCVSHCGEYFEGLK